MKPMMRALALEIFGIFQAALLFHFIDSRRIAGLTAGSIFVVIEVAVMILALRSETGKKSFCLWFGLVMLVVFSLPMLIARVANFEMTWSDIKVWGYSGPQMHRYSMYCYTALMSATLVDAIIIRWKKVWPK